VFGIAFSQAIFGFVRMLTAEERSDVAGVTDTAVVHLSLLS
jgi:hypothetical protein